MKSKVFVLITFILIAGGIFWYVNYERGNQSLYLDSPAINGVSMGNTLSWKSVDHADIYHVYIGETKIIETENNQYVLEDLSPFQTYVFTVEAHDLDGNYEKSNSIYVFSAASQTEIHDLEALDDATFMDPLEGSAFINAYGLSIFRFEPVASTGYLIKVSVDDITHEALIRIRSDGEDQFIPYQSSKGGYTIELEAFKLAVIYVYSLESGQKIDIDIEFLEWMDLSVENDITIGPNQTLQFPILEPDDAYILSVDAPTDEVSIKLFHTIYRTEDIEEVDQLILKPEVKTNMQMIEIKNESDINQTIKITPLIYEEVNNQESVSIHESNAHTYILLTGFETFGYIFNLDFQKHKTDFDVEVYVVHRINGLIKIDEELQDLTNHLFRMRVQLTPSSDLAILIVIKNQTIMDGELEPSTFIGYIA